MKKFFFHVLTLLALIAALTLTACDSGNTNPDENTTEPIVTTEHVHACGDWKQTKEPTCIADGEQQKTCSCGEKEIETLPKVETHTDDGNGACKHCGTPLAPTAGITYELSEDGSYAIVTGYEGTATKVMIADTYEGKPVTEVKQWAFQDKPITTIIIPDSVKKIGSDAFRDCNLSEVSLSNNLTEIGDYAFFGCSVNVCNKYEHLYYLGSEENPYLVLFEAEPLDYTNKDVVIHPDTKIIHSHALKNTNITKIDIHDNIVQIGCHAFQECKKLESVTLGTAITELSGGIFRDCHELKEITVKGTLTKINDYAFYYCKALESFTIPNTVTYIGDGAFNTTGLTSVVMPNSVTHLGTSAFSYCESLHTIVMSDALEEVPYNAFQNCTNLKNLTIGANVKKIKYEAVQSCISLERLIIPNSVVELDSRAFNCCHGLKEVYIGSGLEVIREAAFNSCDEITDVYYVGSEAEYNAIRGYKEELNAAVKHYNYQPE